MKPKLLIIGPGEHGKDSVGDILRDKYGFKTKSSSMFAAEKAVYPLIADVYPDWMACYEDRRNHRELWYLAIKAYNLRPGPCLAAQLLEEYDIYTGMRDRNELENTRSLFDLVVWVDASKRLPPEPESSNKLTASDADYIVDNNGPEHALEGEVDKLATFLSTNPNRKENPNMNTEQSPFDHIEIQLAELTQSVHNLRNSMAGTTEVGVDDGEDTVDMMVEFEEAADEALEIFTVELESAREDLSRQLAALAKMTTDHGLNPFECVQYITDAVEQRQARVHAAVAV